MRQWRELRTFDGINLDRSFVVSWGKEGDTITLELDLVLDRTHPFYETPRPAERECFRQGKVLFPFCSRVNGHDTKEFDPLSLTVGRIVELRELTEGEYEINGEFGKVIVESEEPAVELHSA